MNIPESLSPVLKDILDIEFSAGNTVRNIVIEDNGTIGIEMSQNLKTKMKQILELEKKHKCYIDQHKADYPKIGTGFTDRTTGSYIQDVKGLNPNSPYDFLSPNLIPLLDMELSLGNKIYSFTNWRTEEKAYFKAWMKYPLHPKEAAKIMDESKVKYAAQKPDPWDGGGQYYVCKDTEHVIGSEYKEEEPT